MNKLIEAIKKFITQYYSYLFSFLIFVLLIFGIFKGKVELNIIRFAIAFLLLGLFILVCIVSAAHLLRQSQETDA